VGRQNDSIAAPQEIEHQQHECRHRLRMKAHLGFLDDDPVDCGLLELLALGKEVVEPQQERRELPLPSRPRHERKLGLAVSELQPLRVLNVAQTNRATVEDRVIDDLPVFSLELPLEREEAIAVTRAEPIEQVLAEESRNHGRFDRELLEWSRPPIADQHRAMSGDEEQSFLPVPLSTDVSGLDGPTVERNAGVLAPRRPHADAKDEVDEGRRFGHILAGLSERAHDLPTIEGRLEPLKCQALASALRTHEHGEVAERQPSVFDMCKIADVKHVHGLSLVPARKPGRQRRTRLRGVSVGRPSTVAAVATPGGRSTPRRHRRAG
jgi:hypothetical protein